MIVLDTNVVSEATRPSPSERVRRWFAHQPRTDLCTTAINEAEILFGIEFMPGGKLRFALERSSVC